MVVDSSLRASRQCDCSLCGRAQRRIVPIRARRGCSTSVPPGLRARPIGLGGACKLGCLRKERELPSSPCYLAKRHDRLGPRPESSVRSSRQASLCTPSGSGFRARGPSRSTTGGLRTRYESISPRGRGRARSSADLSSKATPTSPGSRCWRSSRKLGFDTPRAAKVIGAACFVGACVVAGAFVRRLTRPRGRGIDWPEVLPTVFMALCPEFVVWAPSGLENALYWLLMMTLLWLDLRESERPSLVPWSAAAAVGVCLTRPEGALYAAVVGVAKVVDAMRVRESRRQVVLFAGFTVAALGLYHAVHYATFRSFVPNTYYAKVPAAERLGEGQRVRESRPRCDASYMGLSVRARRLHRGATPDLARVRLRAHGALVRHAQRRRLDAALPIRGLRGSAAGHPRRGRHRARRVVARAPPARPRHRAVVRRNLGPRVLVALVPVQCPTVRHDAMASMVSLLQPDGGRAEPRRVSRHASSAFRHDAHPRFRRPGLRVVAELHAARSAGIMRSTHRVSELPSEARRTCSSGVLAHAIPAARAGRLPDLPVLPGQFSGPHSSGCRSHGSPMST